MPEPDFRHVGSVEILRTRLYSLDPYAKPPLATEAIVYPDHYPLYFNGYSHVWVMQGQLNGQFLRRGDGLFLAVKDANAIPININVTFPSKLFGPDDWQAMITDSVFREGHEDQRLRLHLLDKE